MNAKRESAGEMKVRIANKFVVLALLSMLMGTRAMWAVDQKTFASPAEAVQTGKSRRGWKPGRKACGSG